MYEGGKGQEKCVLINSAGSGEVQEKNSGCKSTYCCENEYFIVKASLYFKGAKKNHKMPNDYHAERL